MTIIRLARFQNRETKRKSRYITAGKTSLTDTACFAIRHMQSATKYMAAQTAKQA